MDIREMAEADERSMARIAAALEVLADTAAAWYKLEAARFDKEFPVKPDARDATITRIPSTEDELRASQGSSEESLSTWTSDVGVREQAIIDRPPEGPQKPSPKPRATSKRLPPQKGTRK